MSVHQNPIAWANEMNRLMGDGTIKDHKHREPMDLDRWKEWIKKKRAKKKTHGRHLRKEKQWKKYSLA